LGSWIYVIYADPNTDAECEALSMDAAVSLPEHSVGWGELDDAGTQTCNFIKTTLGKKEGILTATHCLGMKSERDLVFISKTDIFVNAPTWVPAYAEKFSSLPKLHIGASSNKELVGQKVFVQGHLESASGVQTSLRICGTVQLPQPAIGSFLAIRASRKNLDFVKHLTQKNRSFWRGISGSPVIRVSDRLVVGVVSSAGVTSGEIVFSGPDNIESLNQLLLNR